MKKLNNRGFAISTILYSLLIMVFLIVALMMGIMASNRHNTKDLVTTIEEELNRYSLTTTEFSSTDTIQEYIVPYGKAGWYKIELWGASGADYNNNLKGGAGAYTSGVIYLEENTYLYFYVGTTGSGTTGGVNGGGAGNGTGKGGGGATDVRLVNGEWNDTASLKSRIMIASGGGGASSSAAGQNGGTLEAYSYAIETYGQGATQTSGGNAGSGAASGALGTGGAGANNGAGGGSGYYGGGGGGNAGPGAGGSSFIAGYAGVDYASSTTNGRYFIDGMMSENANIGNGKAKIELISTNSKDNPPARKNSTLAAVRYIKDCITGVGSTTAPQWLEIQAISNGTNIALTSATEAQDGSLATIKTDGAFGENKCLEIDLGADKNLDEIAVWHVPSNITTASERILNTHTLQVKSAAGSWQTLIGINSEASTPKSSPEDATGIHISAWDPDSTKALPDGTYYIFTALSPNMGAVTALNSYQDANDAQAKYQRLVGLNPINGSNLQKWTITKVAEISGKSYYKLVERESTQAMQIVDNKGQNNSNINTSSSYADDYQWTQWEIIPLGDGSYRLKPRVQPTTDPNNQTYLATTNNNFGVTSGSLILSTYQKESYSQHFYIINAE